MLSHFNPVRSVYEETAGETARKAPRSQTESAGQDTLVLRGRLQLEECTQYEAGHDYACHHQRHARTCHHPSLSVSSASASCLQDS
jgi:hypothetical protein